MERYPYGVQALFDNIIPVTAVVLLVAILFFVIYYFIYRFYINKKILNGDRTAHSKIVSPAIHNSDNSGRYTLYCRVFCDTV